MKAKSAGYTDPQIRNVCFYVAQGILGFSKRTNLDKRSSKLLVLFLPKKIIDPALLSLSSFLSFHFSWASPACIFPWQNLSVTHLSQSVVVLYHTASKVDPLKSTTTESWLNLHCSGPIIMFPCSKKCEMESFRILSGRRMHCNLAFSTYQRHDARGIL